jgi:hypothetical protein
MNYLLDSNTLIEAKNRYYQMLVCPGYWTWIVRNQEAGELASVNSVAEELRRGNDELAEWAEVNRPLFLPESDEATQTSFAEVAQHIASQTDRMRPGAMEEFLGGADPWLIAKARVTGAVVVTHEQFHPEARRKFLIPNVCRHFGITWMDTFQLLGRLNARFVLEG